MSRRSHKKSRTGCTRCKRRHIKCDESRPKCSHCVTANFECEYISVHDGPQSTAENKTGISMTNTSFSPSSISTGASTTTLQGSPSNSSSAALTPGSRPAYTLETGLNLDHMELLHHFCTVTYKTMSPQVEHQDTWHRVAVQHGLSYPFLLYQLLAVSSLHLAHLTPTRQAHYSTKATEMQSHALETFNSVQTQLNHTSCGAILLFSSLLALSVFADRSETHQMSAPQYLSHLLQCLQLMRSSRRVVVTEWMPQIKASDLAPLLQIQQPTRPFNVPHHLRDLEFMISSSPDLSQSSVTAYSHAIERLQWMFALASIPQTTHNTIRWMLAWPMQVEDTYAELLEARRPEALVILAYYGVVLHSYRESWAVGDSGLRLVEAISEFAGEFWGRWMDWPLAVVRGET